MRKVLVALFLSVISGCYAQDTLTKVPAPQVADTGHSVKKAVILSAVLPGAGQVYNHLAMPKGRKKAYWKVPLIYAGLGATGYLMIKNNQSMKALRSEYEFRVAGNDPQSYLEYDDQGLLDQYTADRTQRDLFIVGFGLVYLLNVVDAGVEAHFVNFDISDDLTMSVQPAVLPNYALGVGVTFKFR